MNQYPELTEEQKKEIAFDWFSRQSAGCILESNTETSWRAECEKQYEQELWDKVAVASMNGLISCDAFHGGLYQQNPENAAVFGTDCADAFMAERAKRLKERE